MEQLNQSKMEDETETYPCPQCQGEIGRAHV
jgi:hypothetical protein